jgi:hypothetical protein
MVVVPFGKKERKKKGTENNMEGKEQKTVTSF